MSSAASANNFGAFLSTINLGSPTHGASAVDPEALGKSIMTYLAQRGQAVPVVEVSRALNLTADEIAQVLPFLTEHEMAEVRGGPDATEIELTEFAASAMQVFRVK